MSIYLTYGGASEYYQTNGIALTASSAASSLSMVSFLPSNSIVSQRPGPIDSPTNNTLNNWRYCPGFTPVSAATLNIFMRKIIECFEPGFNFQEEIGCSSVPFFLQDFFVIFFRLFKKEIS